MQLVLHADVERQRLLGRTVTDYRNIRIEAMVPVLAIHDLAAGGVRRPG